MGGKMKFFLKWFGVPCIYILSLIILAASGNVGFISGGELCIICIKSVLYSAAAAFGWLFLPPWFVLTLSLAYSKNRRVPYFAAYSFPVFSAVFFCISFLDEVKYVCESAGELLLLLFFVPSSAFSAFSTALVMMYLLILPSVIADMAVTHMRDKYAELIKEEDKRAVMRRIGISMGAVLSVIIVFFGVSVAVDNHEELVEQMAISQHEVEVAAQKAEMIDTYGDELLALTEYSHTHDISDWTECHDERFEEVWREVFCDGTGRMELTDEGAEFYFSEYSISAENGKCE